jgi:hypothetical protein
VLMSASFLFAQSTIPAGSTFPVGSTKPGAVNVAPAFANNGAGMPVTQAPPPGITDTITVVDSFLPNPTISGNTLLLWLRYDTTAQTVTWSDNIGGNTYIKATSCTDATNGVVGEVWYVSGIRAGVQEVAVTLAARHHPQLQLYEFYNIGALDQVACQASSGTSVTSGALPALTAVNDLVFQFGAVTNGTQLTSISTTNQTNMPWTLRSAMIADTFGSGVQYGVYNDTVGFSPTFTVAPTTNYIAASVAFKSASAGSAPPSGVRVCYVQHDNTQNETASTVALKYPITGNAIAVLSNSGCNGSGFSGDCAYATSASDGTNTYEQIGSTTLSQATDDFNAVGNAWLASGVSPGVYSVTWTMNPRSSGGNGTSFWMHDICGAGNTNPLDIGFGPSGLAQTFGEQNKTGGSGNVTSFSGTPTNQNEVMIGQIGSQWDSYTGLSAPSGANQQNCYYTTISNPSHCDLNAGVGDFYNATSTASQTWTWTHDTNTSSGVGSFIANGMALMSTNASSGAGTWSVIQHKSYDHTCSNTLTCALTGLTAIGTGHMLVVTLSINNNNAPTMFTSISGISGGQWINDGGCYTDWNPSAGINFQNYCIYNLAPASGGTSLTVNLASTSSASVNWGADVWELAWSGSTVLYDAAGKITTETCTGTSCPGVALTLNGTKDVIIQSIQPQNNNITAITGGAGYTTFEDFLAGFGSGYAAAINTTTGTAPTWTDSGSGDKASASAIAFKGQ